MTRRLCAIFRSSDHWLLLQLSMMTDLMLVWEVLKLVRYSSKPSNTRSQQRRREAHLWLH